MSKKPTTTGRIPSTGCNEANTPRSDIANESAFAGKRRVTAMHPAFAAPYGQGPTLSLEDAVAAIFKGTYGQTEKDQSDDQ